MFWQAGKSSRSSRRWTRSPSPPPTWRKRPLTIGPGGVLLLLGAAAVGAAATYYVGQKPQKQKGRLDGGGLFEIRINRA